MNLAELAAMFRDDVPGNVSRRQCRYWRTYRRPAFVSDVSDALNVDAGQVMVTCEAVPSVAELRGLAGDGWSVAVESHWPTLRRDGQTVRWLPAWTGTPCTPDDAGRYWTALEQGCARIAPGGVPLGSPGVTGRDLWLRLLPEHVSYPTPGPAVAGWLRETSGQGRIQIMPARSSTVPAIYEYDQRLAYLAVLAELPAGRPVVGCGGDITEYARGRAYASWSRGTGDGRPSPFAPGGWPAEGHGWVDLAEVRLARRHGWRVDVDHAVVWPERCSPFRTWASRLFDMIGRIPAGVPAPVWRATWRSVALHTIGAMHGAPRRRSHFGTEAPAAADDARLEAGGVVRWSTESPALWADTLHPEWTTTVWSRARLRLLDAPQPGGGRVGAWHLPAGVECVAFRTDALYVTAMIDWRDDGRPGRFRLKRSAFGPVRWPKSQRELLYSLGDA